MKPPILHRIFVLALAWVFCASAAAQEDTIRKVLAERIPDIQIINEVTPSVIPGLYEVRVNGTQIVYSDAHAEHLFIGDIHDLAHNRNLTKERESKLMAIKFDALPFQDAFSVVRGNGERKFAIFEDPNCGYCKRFERDLQKINNVTVYVFLYPVLGGDSPQKSTAIWCAKDRAKVWQAWMVNGQALPKDSKCDNTALKRNLEFGQSNAITGTPTLVLSDGSRVPGAIKAEDLEKLLSESKS